MTIAGQKAKHVDRVLDVRQGELGWVVGTVYMDLPLKPNVLEDLARDVTSLLGDGMGS
jgi:DNA polymerase delta subunit 2